MDAHKQQVRTRHDTSKWKCEGDEDLYPLFDAILSFLNEVCLVQISPFVLINGEPTAKHAVLEKYNIVQSPRCPSLKVCLGSGRVLGIF